jgi:plasmid stabilization system protein ParE
MRKLVITTLARKNLSELLEHLEIRFGDNVRRKFVNKLNKSLGLIADNPNLFPKSEFNYRMRKCVITKQSTVYYTFSEQEIKILMVFDTRQNPNKIKE